MFCWSLAWPRSYTVSLTELCMSVPHDSPMIFYVFLASLIEFEWFLINDCIVVAFSTEFVMRLPLLPVPIAHCYSSRVSITASLPGLQLQFPVGLKRGFLVSHSFLISNPQYSMPLCYSYCSLVLPCITSMLPSFVGGWVCFVFPMISWVIWSLSHAALMKCWKRLLILFHLRGWELRLTVLTLVDFEWWPVVVPHLPWRPSCYTSNIAAAIFNNPWKPWLQYDLFVTLAHCGGKVRKEEQSAAGYWSVSTFRYF